MTRSQIKALIKSELKTGLTRVMTQLQIDKGTKLRVKRNDRRKKRDLDEQFKVTDKKAIG